MRIRLLAQFAIRMIWSESPVALLVVQRRRWPDDLYDPLPRSRDGDVNDWWFGKGGLGMDRGDMAYLYVDLTAEEKE